MPNLLATDPMSHEPAPPAPLSEEHYLRLYRQMLLIRRCEEQLARSHQRGLVHGACHTYVGQEAVAVGVCAHLRADDEVFSTHRGHGHALAKGLPPGELIAELYGRATGCSRGRGVRVNAILPAQVVNPGLEARMAADPGLRAKFLSGIPAGRLGRPDDIRGLAVFLASDASAWVTGALIPMDGGNLAMNAGGTPGRMKAEG